MNSTQPRVSFIIPAFNEARYITATLTAIQKAIGSRCEYEIVVVDNGSTDRTVELARLQGARVLARPGITVSELRNEGVKDTSGPVLVFLDADVTLTAEWGENILDAVAEITERHKLLTGSTCGIPDDASWIERSWFGPKVRIPQSHLNSGHLVVGRAFFEEIGGFDGSLRTGEDYDISVRALRAGAEIHENGRLSVVHHGYPRTLRAFVRREMWHGHSDYDSLRSILASRVALASILFALLHIAFVIGVLLSLKWVVLASTVGVVGLCYAASYQRYPREAWSIIVANAGIYYFYLAARFLAFVRRLLPMQRFTHREER